MAAREGYSLLIAVTPSDATDVDCRGLYVGGAGIVAYTDMRGTNRVTGSIVAGATLEIWCKKVLSTGTTATAISAYF